MKKEIILVSIILLIPTIVYAVNLEIQIVQPFPNNMTGGNTYSSQFNITNNINKEVPIFFIFYINKTIPIDPAEYNLGASIDSFNLNCSQFYPGYWECWNNTGYYFFPPLSQKILNLNLSLNVATIPSSFNYTLEVDGSSQNARPTLDNISSNVTCVKQNYPVNITTVNAYDADFDSLTLFVNSSILCSATGQPELSCVFLTPWNDTSSHTIYGSVNDSWETSEIRTLSINSDNSGPNSPTPLSPINNSITNPIPTFSWSIPTDVGCNSLINRYRIQVHSGLSCSGGAVKYKEGNITSWTFSDYSFENGTYSWKVRARDGFNNWGNWSECMRLIINNIPPRVENSSIPSIEFGGNVAASVNVWDENGVDKVILERYTDLFKFDFGMDASPVENGYTKITKSMLKNSTNAYGWVTSPSGDRDRIAGTDLTRDLIFDSVDRIFLVNLTNGKYLVTTIMGDMNYSHDMMNVYAEGLLKLNDINTSAGQIKWLNFTINVNDGQLNITFHDDGGSDPNWVCNGLIIRFSTGSFNMNKSVNNTYNVTIINSPIGNYTVLYFANDTVGNVNDTTIDSFNVIMPPSAKVILVTITPSTIFNNTIYVGSGNTKFNISFDRKMNTSIQPTVKFGLSPIIIDDGDLGYSDTNWTYYPGQGYGNDVHYTAAGIGSNNATWTPNITATGNYSVYVSWTTHPNRATNANYTISYNGGNYSFIVNQENYANGSVGGSLGEWSDWYYAGTFNFAIGTNGSVVLNDNANEYVIADAVKFESVKKNTVLGNWINSTLWSGTFTITPTTGNGKNTLNITEAKDFAGNIVAENTSTWFIIGAAPRFLTVIISPSVNNTYVKAGNASFTIIFSQAMNMSVKPNVTFGQYQPYNTYTINGLWINTTVWVGYYNITSSMSNVWYTISISGAHDWLGNILAPDTSYKFLIDTKSPKIWDILTANITVEENETISAKVIDQTPYGQSSSGIDKVIVELNNGTNFTMQLGYVNINYLFYYVNISNSSYGSGWQSLRFYVNDTAGNVNNTEKATFFVNSSIPKIGGKIAFLCKDYACNDDNEPKLIAWLKSEGWNVTTNRVDRWNITELNKTDVMVCSDSGIACELGSRYTYDTYKMYMKKMPFVEIGDTTTLRAANNFGYTKTKLGYAITNISNIYVTISDPITTGHFGSTTIFSSNKTMTTISDNLLLVKDLADAGNDNSKSTFFKSDQSGSHGRYLYVGWFNGQFSDLNELGNITLARAISWAQCGNAKGCKV